jgi:iron complex outermembrane receptor protein
MLKRLTKAALVAGVAAGAFGAASMAHAEAGSADSQKASVLGEVVVTARRREERLLDVPIAVTVLGSEDLKRQLVRTVQDMTEHTPSLLIHDSSQGPSNPVLTIRGQTVIENSPAVDPTVMVYFADVVMERAQGVNSALYDLSSVQVLKGPQGTLFGRSTTGGALVITPAKPRLDEFSGELGAGSGNYDRTHAEFAFNIPLGPKLAVRLAGLSESHSGYVTNLYDNSKLADDNLQSARLSVLFKPTDAVENTLVVQYLNDHERAGMGAKSLTPAALNTTFFGRFGTVVPEIQREQAILATKDFWTVFNDIAASLGPPGIKLDTWTASNITTWDLNENITLKNVLGYRSIHYRTAIDGDGTAAQLNVPAGHGAPLAIWGSIGRTIGTEQTEEFQIIGNSFNHSLQWIAGAYAFNEHVHDYLITSASVAFLSEYDSRVRNKSYSVFAQGTYKPPQMPKLSLTLGVRQNWDDRGNNLTGLNTPLASSTANCTLLHGGVPIAPPCNRTYPTQSYDALTYTASIDYKVTDHSLIYATTRRGYRSGGITERASDDVGGVFFFRPEFVKDYEIGAKLQEDFAGMPVRLQVAGYYQDYTDMQRQITVTNPVTFKTDTLILNAGKARITGIEVEGSIKPVPMVELSGFFGQTNAKYLQFINPITNAEFKDNTGVPAPQLPFSSVPKMTGGATIRVNLPVPESVGAIGVQANVYWQDKYRESDLSVGDIPSYSVVNLSGDWTNVFGHPVDIRAFVKNLLEEKYYTGGINLASLGFQGVYIGSPRTFGVDVAVHF